MEGRDQPQAGGGTDSPDSLHQLRELQRENAELREQFRVVSDLGMRLSTELDTERLLPQIVTAARRFTGSEAGSLYVREGDELVFVVAQNDRVDLESEDAPALPKIRLPLDDSSLAGLAAAECRTLNIEDASHHPSLSQSARDKFGYEVKTMLLVPMQDHRGDVLGVLQLMNALGPGGEVQPFTERAAFLSGLLASHAATAIQIAHLYSELKEVFQSLIRYTTAAIDARDPCTAGHSSRVGRFAREVGREMGGFREEQLQELRFSGLFHDVGKIGVREAVLTKSDKLTPPEMRAVRERLRLAGEAAIAEALRAGSPGEGVAAGEAVARELLAEQGFLDRVNRPGWLEDADLEHLAALRARTFRDFTGEERSLLNDDEHEKLSVRRGNLTDAERRDIERHVVDSYRFLKKLPFPAEMASIPDIVHQHHEKVDGSGYPLGLAGDDILLQARILAVVDVFDALTAADRPYKKAMTAQRAVEVIEKEVESGAWDGKVVAALRRLAEAGTLLPRRREKAAAARETPPPEASVDQDAWT